jgi:hypothetical protein
MYFWPLLPFAAAGVCLLALWWLLATEDEEEPGGRGPRPFGRLRPPRPPGSDDGEGAG